MIIPHSVTLTMIHILLLIMTPITGVQIGTFMIELLLILLPRSAKFEKFKLS